MALLFRLSEFGRAFSTRGRGGELRDELRARSVSSDTVIVDFEEITNVSYSFADELLGVLVSEECQDDVPRITPINMTAPVSRVVQRVIDRRRETPIAC